jgi:phage gpG-like protein
VLSQLVPEFAADMEALLPKLEAAVPEMLRVCEPLVLENIVENFARQESPDGLAWPERKKVGDGHPLLVETNSEGSGSLLAAATGQGGGHVSRIEGDTLVVGVDKAGGIGGIPGAGVHNYRYPEKNIPQREYLGIGKATEDECIDLIGERAMQEMV